MWDAARTSRFGVPHARRAIDPIFPGFAVVGRSASPLRAFSATANGAPHGQASVETPVRCAEVRKRSALPASRRTSAVVAVASNLRAPHAGGGGARSQAISARISWNLCRDTAPRPSGSRQPVQQRLRLFQIRRVKALGKPAIDRRQEIRSPVRSPRPAHRGARSPAARNSTALAAGGGALEAMMSSATLGSTSAVDRRRWSKDENRLGAQIPIEAPSQEPSPFRARYGRSYR